MIENYFYFLLKLKVFVMTKATSNWDIWFIIAVLWWELFAKLWVAWLNSPLSPTKKKIIRVKISNKSHLSNVNYLFFKPVVT